MKINIWIGYCMVFSLSSDKEIKVNFGDYYNLRNENQFYKNKRFKYNNL